MMSSVEDNQRHNLMIIAGEISGDLIGASLIKELKKMDPKIVTYGIGGNQMQIEGMNILYHINQMAFLGFSEIVKHLPFIKKVQSELLTILKKKKIKSVVLIDYPGFNLSIAKKIKKSGVKIIYYVSPQLWAWGSGRMKKIKNRIDKMLVVFPFEQKLYTENHIDVELVGHPLVERINNYKFLSRKELFQKFQLDESKDILLLMPGSRRQEVEKIYPQIVNAAKKLGEEFNLQIVTAGSVNIDIELFNQLSETSDIKVVRGYTYDLIKQAKFGIIKSGTSTLEAAYFALPMIIVYKTSRLTYLIGKQLIKVNNIGMPNILLEDDVVPELIQSDVSKEKIYKAGKQILGDQNRYSSIKIKLSEVKNKLGIENASALAAKHIYELMNEA